MINIEKDYSYNYTKLRNMEKSEVRNEKDLYHLKLCIIYLSRQLLVHKSEADLKEINAMLQGYTDKYERTKNLYTLPEKFINDIRDYESRPLPTMRVIKSDYHAEAALQIFVLGVLTVLTILFAVYNDELAKIYIIILSVVVVLYLYYAFTGKRFLITTWIRALSMLGNDARTYRDNIWIDAFKAVTPETHVAYELVSKLEKNFTSRYIAEMLHEKYVQVDKSRK